MLVGASPPRFYDATKSHETLLVPYCLSCSSHPTHPSPQDYVGHNAIKLILGSGDKEGGKAWWYQCTVSTGQEARDSQFPSGFSGAFSWVLVLGLGHIRTHEEGVLVECFRWAQINTDGTCTIALDIPIWSFWMCRYSIADLRWAQIRAKEK